MNYNLNLFMAYTLEALTHRLVLANLISNTKKIDYQGRIGQTVDVYLDILADVTTKTYTAANKADNVDYSFDAINLDTVPVRLENELYAAVMIDGWDKLVITEENLGSFVQWGLGLASKIANQVEAGIAAVLNAVTQAAGSAFGTANVKLEAATDADKGAALIKQITREKLALDKAGVAPTDRFLVVGDNVAVSLINNKDVLNIDKSGSPEALREATITRIAGFTVVSSSYINADSYVAFHKSAFVLASREPGKNISAVYSEVITAPNAAVDLRFNILGLGARNATGLLVSNFWVAANLDSEHRAIKRNISYVAPVAIPAA
jgi:hypothetical protein